MMSGTASERPAMAFCRADGSGGNPALVQLGGTEARARALEFGY